MRIDMYVYFVDLHRTNYHSHPESTLPRLAILSSSR